MILLFMWFSLRLLFGFSWDENRPFFGFGAGTNWGQKWGQKWDQKWGRNWGRNWGLNSSAFAQKKVGGLHSEEQFVQQIMNTVQLRFSILKTASPLGFMIDKI